MKKLWQEFNPSLKEKMAKNPRLTVLGLWWAGYWRFYVLITIISVVVFGVFFVSVFILSFIFAKIFF